MITAIILYAMSTIAYDTVPNDNEPTEACILYVSDALTHVTLDTIEHACNPGRE